MKQKQFKIPYVEFYITNVCNLNCTDCNRYNNFAFKNHFKWNEIRDTYAKWAEVLDIEDIGILGGEPLANPDLPNWVNGILELWPNATVNIVSNGTMLENNAVKLRELLDNPRMKLRVSAHNKYELDNVRDQIDTLLDRPYNVKIRDDVSYEWFEKSYNAIKAENWPECKTPSDFKNLPEHVQYECEYTHNFSGLKWRLENSLFMYTDGKRTIYLRLNDQFSESALRFDNETHEFTLHNNDPKDAIAVCSFVTCPHFIGGKLHKCGPVGILPMFMEQYKVTVTDKQQELINTYMPAEYNWDKEKMDAFIENLISADPIPQCSLCPATNNPAEIHAGPKKIKIKQL